MKTHQCVRLVTYYSKVAALLCRPNPVRLAKLGHNEITLFWASFPTNWNSGQNQSSTVKHDFKNIFGHCHFGSLSQVVLILTVLKANLVNLVISNMVLKPKLVLILTVLKVKFDCPLRLFTMNIKFSTTAI